MKVEIEIHNVADELPEAGKKVFVLGHQARMNPQMGGSYWFKTHRINPNDLLKLNQLNRRHYDKNGFQALYVTRWCELPLK